MPNPESRPFVAPEPSTFEVAVRDRAWDWLFELRRRSNVELALIDGRPCVLAPVPVREQQTALAAAVERRDPRLLRAIAAAVRSRGPQAAEVDGLRLACVALAGGRGGGALLVARAGPAGPGDTREAVSHAHLSMLATWLGAAVDAHLASPPACPAGGLGRVTPLSRLLTDTAARESDRELVRLFGDAVAVWHDVEVSGYVETPSGSFVLDVSLPGASPGERPLAIPVAELPASTDLVPLPQGLLDRFALPVHATGYARRFAPRDGCSWLLVFTGDIDAYGAQRLATYASLLDLAFGMSTAIGTAGIVSAVTRLLAGGDSAAARATAALDGVRAALGAASAVLTIERQGRVVLRAEVPQARAMQARRSGVRLVKRVERHYTTSVSLGRHESLPFTPRDHAVAAAAAAVFALWAGVFNPIAGCRERRAAPRGFHDELERSASEAIQRGSPVAVAVLLIPDAAASPGSTERWVAAMRGRMRVSDMAGMLGRGEIGLLVNEAAAAEALAVADRLCAVVNGAAGGVPIVVGIAGRRPGSADVAGMVREARMDAAGSRRLHDVSSSEGAR